MTRTEIESLFERRLEAYRRLDAAALSADHAEDCVVESPTAGIVTGRQAIEDVYAAVFRAFPDLEIQMTDLVVDGDRAVFVGITQGTNAGGFMGLPASGKRFKFPCVFVYTLRDGQIIHERRVYDFTGMLVQIGILKARPA